MPDSTTSKIHRRPVIVLAVLMGAMTVASGYLLMLEPGSMLQPASVISLRAQSDIDITAAPLFDTAEPVRAWDSIVICESGPGGQSANALTGSRADQGSDAQSYHFVIEADRGRNEPLVRAGANWRYQRLTASSAGRSDAGASGEPITICLVADSHVKRPGDTQMTQLIELVQRLQRRFVIGPGRVLLEGDIDAHSPTGRLFPVGHLRERLLSPQ